jgi:predicted GNAT family acetyltransferase
MACGWRDAPDHNADSPLGNRPPRRKLKTEFNAIMSEENSTTTRQAVTTTHAAWGAGHPRILATSEHERYVHELKCDLIHIGSAADADLKLLATDALHAKILHDQTDEYVLTMFGEGATSSGRDVILRTGAHFTAGPWRIIFVRDEFADHGRPYGGRIGGEAGHQRPQSPRPDYAREHPVSSLARCAIKQPDGTDDRDQTPDLGQSVLLDQRADGSDRPPISFDVVNDEIAGIYEAAVGGTAIGGVPYNLVGGDRMAILAVSVFPDFRGRGVSTELIRRVLDDVRARGKSIINYCPVVHRFIENNPGYADLVDADHPPAARRQEP